MAFDFEESAIRLYERHGMKPVRWHDELLRDLNDLTELVIPPGVDNFPWDPDRSEEARIAQNAAFATIGVAPQRSRILASPACVAAVISRR